MNRRKQAVISACLNNVLTQHFYYFFFPVYCVRAEAATLFTVFEELGLDNNLLAFEATFFDVDSFLFLLMVTKLLILLT